MNNAEKGNMVLFNIEKERNTLLEKIEELDMEDKITFINAHAQMLNERSKRIFQKSLITPMSKEDIESLARTATQNAASYNVLAILINIDAVEQIKKLETDKGNDQSKEETSK